MSTFTQREFKNHLAFLIRHDRQFRKDFTDLLFEFDRNVSGIPSSLTERMTSELADGAESGVFYLADVEEEFIKLLNHPKIIPIVRVMRLTENSMNRNTWSRRFQDFAFSDETGVDLFLLSNDSLRVQRFQVFDNLKEEEKTLLEQLTVTEIDSLSDITARGITIARLSGLERSFLSSLGEERIHLVKKFGFRRTRLLSRFEVVVRDLFLGFENCSTDFTDMGTGGGRWLLEGICELRYGEREVLGNLIDERGAIIKNFSVVEDVEELLGPVSVELFNEQQKNVLENLSESEIKVLRGLESGVLKVASALTRTQLDELLLLPKGLLEEISKQDLRSFAPALPENRLTRRIGRLEPDEEIALKLLNKNQRTILARVYNLPPRAVRVLSDLDSNRFVEVMTTFQFLERKEVRFDRAEKFLMRKIEELSPEDRQDLVWITREEWNSCRGIHLTSAGIDVLKATVLLSDEQLDFVRNTSRTGLAVLAGNSRLGPRMIKSIMRLSNDEEKEFLLNLDLKARSSIRVENHPLYKVMAEFDYNEMWWTQQNNISVSEIKLFTHLDRNRAGLFADLFEFIDSDQNAVFNVWKMLYDGTNEEFAAEALTLDSTLLANVIMASKTLRYSHVFDAEFFMESLRLSVEDGLGEDVSLSIVHEISSRNFDVRDLAGMYEKGRLFGWILKNSLKPEYAILYNVSRTMLFDRLYGSNDLVIDESLDFPALHKQFVDQEYQLAQAIFFSPEHSALLPWILNPEECSHLLRSEITVGLHRIPYLYQQSRDVFSIFQTNAIKLFKVSSFFNRGDVTPLLERLGKATAVEFLNTDLGRELLHSRPNLLSFLSSNAKDSLRKDDYSILRSFISDVELHENPRISAETLHMLREIDPTIPESYCTEAFHKVIRYAQETTSTETTASIVRYLMKDFKGWTTRGLLNPQVEMMVFDETPNGCDSSGSAPCIDSRDFGEYVDPTFLIATKELGSSEYEALTFKKRMRPIRVRIDYRWSMFQWDDVEEHIGLVKRENFEYYWSMFLNKELTRRMEIRSGAENVLERYVSRILDRFGGQYDRIGLSLPRWIVGKTEYKVIGRASGLVNVSCTLRTRYSAAKLIFDRRVVVRDAFNEALVAHDSRLLPQRIKGFDISCRPSATDLEVERVIQHTSPHFDQACDGHPDVLYPRISTERYRLPGIAKDRCQNMVLYEKNSSPRLMIYVPQDYMDWQSSKNDSIDLIFLGRYISFNISKTGTTTNHFLLKNDLLECKIRGEGSNFFYTDRNGLLCDLDRTENVAVVRGDFVDAENIRSVIGNEGRNKLKISHAIFVDGKGGNDNIIADYSTIVQGHPGDLITGSATILLPGRVDEIHTIVMGTTTIVFRYKSGTSIEIGENCKSITADGYFVIPIPKSRILRLHKISRITSELEEQLTELRGLKNDHFHLVKHLSSRKHCIILTEMNTTVFTMDKNEHNYYWEAPTNSSNLYIFAKPDGNVTISQANGILDFGSLNYTKNDFAFSSNIKRGMTIDGERLHVLLLPNYNEMRITLDGKKYYDLHHLTRDYCSHPLKVRGNISIDPPEMMDHHDCLDFHSDKVHFVNSSGNLILVSGMGAVSLKNYYSSLHSRLDLSLRSNSGTLTPNEFRMRAEKPCSMKYYRVEQRGLQIYHNQPEERYEIGLLDLKHWSISKIRMKIFKYSLSIVNEDRSTVTLENWATCPSARELILSFENGASLNSACVISYCEPENILKEFEGLRSQTVGAQREAASCIANNLGFLLSVVQSFLDKKHPLPAQRPVSPEEILADACRITLEFEDALIKNAEALGVHVEGLDFFHVYENIVRLTREEKYSMIVESLYDISKSVGLSDMSFLDKFNSTTVTRT